MDWPTFGNWARKEWTPSTEKETVSRIARSLSATIWHRTSTIGAVILIKWLLVPEHWSHIVRWAKIFCTIGLRRNMLDSARVRLDASFSVQKSHSYKSVDLATGHDLRITDNCVLKIFDLAFLRKHTLATATSLICWLWTEEASGSEQVTHVGSQEADLLHSLTTYSTPVCLVMMHPGNLVGNVYTINVENTRWRCDLCWSDFLREIGIARERVYK